MIIIPHLLKLKIHSAPPLKLRTLGYYSSHTPKIKKYLPII